MHIDFPFHVDGSAPDGRRPSDDEHVRDLIEQVLFTRPGERVNRPGFGSGLQQLVFAPNSPELAAAVQFLVQGALQQYLADVIRRRAGRRWMPWMPRCRVEVATSCDAPASADQRFESGA